MRERVSARAHLRPLFIWRGYPSAVCTHSTSGSKSHAPSAVPSMASRSSAWDDSNSHPDNLRYVPMRAVAVRLLPSANGVFDDAANISAGLGPVGRIQLVSGERLKRLRERGLQKPLVTYAVDSAESNNHGRMYCESLVFGDGSEAHFASSSNTSAYSSMKSMAASIADASALAGWIITQGSLFLRTVTGLTVLLTSAATREKSASTSVRSVVSAATRASLYSDQHYGQSIRRY